MKRTVRLGLVAAFLLGSVGCGGGGGGGGGDTPPENGVKLSGVVMAPEGQVAKLQDKGIVYALLDRLVNSADAATTGISAVSGATVTAVRVDGSGNVLATLGSATTDLTGHFILTLPSGTVLAPTIIVRVQGGGIQLRAPAVQAMVDITPASEWLLQQLTAASAALDTLSNDDLLFLQAVLESYTVDAGGDIAATLANLSPLQALIAAEIAAVQASTTTPSLDGSWVISGNDIMVGNVSSTDQNGVWISGQWINTLSDYTVTLTKQSGNTYDVTLNGEESETSLYAHGSDCSVSATQPYVNTCTFVGYNWAADGDGLGFYETNSFGPVSTTLQIFTLDDGRVVIPSAAEESIESGDMFAYVSPPYVEAVMPMGANDDVPDAYAGIAAWPTFAFALSSDGLAADRTQLRGASGDIKPMALIRRGSNMGNATLNGTYAFIFFNQDIQSDGDRAHSVFTGTVGANGAGTVGAGTVGGVELSRVANGANTAALTGTAFSADITGGSYTVASDGALILDLTADTVSPPTLSGQLNGGGNFFYASAAEADTGATPQQVIHTAIFGIKVDTAAPTLSGKSYRFHGTDLEYGAGTYSRYGHLADSTLAFTDGTNVTLTINAQEIDRSDDVTAIVSQTATIDEELIGTYTTAANGAFTVTVAGGSTFRGYVNSNAMLAIHQSNFPANGSANLSTEGATLGIAMGRCTNC